MELPENAFRELKEGEDYKPIIDSEKVKYEVTARSIIFGLITGIIFSAAAAYIALKLGQGIESAIPISILAVGFSSMMHRKSSLIENVNILAVGATSGIIVGGSVFTMPAIFILGLESRSSFFQILIVPFLGAVLGVLFLIPFRRYFVSQMHGKLPFPEATATTEILVAGESGGKQAKILLYSMSIGLIMDYLSLGMQAWRDTFSTALVKPLSFMTDKLKAVFALNTSAAILGLGYIIGLRYATIILAGSLLSFFVLVPAFAYLGSLIPVTANSSLADISQLSAVDIFKNHVRYIGIGTIFTAGILSILKMSPIIIQAIKEMFKVGKNIKAGSEKRLDRDIPLRVVMLLTLAVSVLIFIYFRFSVLKNVQSAWLISLVSLGLALSISFLFAAVSAWAVAMISITPVSGMTLTTLIISSIILSQLGLKGPDGMIATLLIGGVVCTALAMTGSLVTQFKIGYWLGSTPKTIQWGNLFGSFFSSATVTLCIFLFYYTYGYKVTALHPNPMAAPQASAMAAIIQSVMESGSAPWFLYFFGAVIAIIIEMLGISALAFGLGMYLPIELNSPLIIGAGVAHLLQKGGNKSKEVSKKRHDKGMLIASGFIAGGALAGVVDSVFKMLEDKFGTFMPQFNNTASTGNWMALFLFIGLACYVYWDSRR